MTDEEKPKTIIIASSPTGRILADAPEWQHLKLSGSTPEVVIVDDLAEAEKDPDRNPHWPEKFPEINWPDIDYAEIERRVYAAGLGSVDVSGLARSFGQLGAACKKLSALDFKSILEAHPTLLMTKHEQQHAGHPTEKNPNHPRFQHQPHRPRRRK